MAGISANTDAMEGNTIHVLGAKTLPMLLQNLYFLAHPKKILPGDQQELMWWLSPGVPTQINHVKILNLSFWGINNVTQSHEKWKQTMVSMTDGPCWEELKLFGLEAVWLQRRTFVKKMRVEHLCTSWKMRDHRPRAGHCSAVRAQLNVAPWSFESDSIAASVCLLFWNQWFKLVVQTVLKLWKLSASSTGLRFHQKANENHYQY